MKLLQMNYAADHPSPPELQSLQVKFTMLHDNMF